MRAVVVDQSDQPYWDSEFVAYYSGAEQSVGAAAVQARCVILDKC